MKTHRMYRKGREEVPNILVIKPGVNYVPAELFYRYMAGSTWFSDTTVENCPPFKKPMCKCEATND